MWRIGALCIAWLLAAPAHAFDPQSLPAGAEQTYDQTEEAGSVFLPVGTITAASPFERVEGSIRWRAWRISSPGFSTLTLLRQLREDLAEAGYETVLDCATAECGGFDFRYGLPVLPAPEMNVDLFDFRVITARNGDAQVFLLVSRGRLHGYLQLIEVQGGGAPVEPEATGDATGPDAPEEPEADAELIDVLRTAGHVVLDDLDFQSGAAALADREYTSLAELAVYIKGDPARIVALVGHTDAVGAHDANVALSRRRAEAVRQRLIDRHGVAGSQVSARGAGFLAPVASNLTALGRERNRRVEAVLLAAE
ncbi:OmpA domain protein [Pseudooceanicola batsensis HTCC2597]|uniref:OmpA domain protein n=1 Tax=Pseudooceanicola batsensis (strain ATCC BAA-863 / DSM 15984 / KCTC 12145 / HTCC2597) TaxID=252305 RepID=A3TVV1_PSEBH|nr:OmpA family protein [Pseudooceanicola batsensis]EAQ03747.1 OmpA domain protein [Pseudooceanicola batsensis HTCC2597]